MTPSIRLLAAFLAAPLVAVIVVGLIVAITSGIPPIGFLLAVAEIACIVTFVVGIPAYLLTRAWHLRSLASFAAVAAVVSLIPAALLALAYPESPDLWLSTICAGGVSGIVFGLIVRETSNEALNTDAPKDAAPVS